MVTRPCFRPPIPEIEATANILKEAVSAHLLGERAKAAELFRLANSDAVRAWVEKDANGKRLHIPPVPPRTGPKLERGPDPRLATPDTERKVHERDGYYCRFCKIPVIRVTGGKTRPSVAYRIRSAYPDAVPWGRPNASMHAAFLCMWAQYDHIKPHSHGGTSELSNLVLTCGPCNWDRGEYTLEEMGIAHPDTHAPRRGPWTGLEEFR